MALTDKEKAEREGPKGHKVGSSDAPVIAGVSSYKSPLELYYQFTGALPRYTDDETTYQRLGKRLEPVIADLAAEELNIKIRRVGVRTHAKYPWCVSHADREIISHPRGRGVFEVKNRAGERPWDQVPDDIEVQVRHQMACDRVDWALVAAMFRFGKIKTYEIERDPEIEEYIIELEYRFIQRVQRGEVPVGTDWAPDVDLMKKLYPRDSGQVLTLDSPKALALVSMFTAARAQEKEMEQAKKSAAAQLQAMLGDAAEAHMPGYKVSWRMTKPAETETVVDLPMLALEFPEAYAKVVSQKPKAGHRVFLVRQTK